MREKILDHIKSIQRARLSLKKSAESRKIADAEVEEDVAAAVAIIGPRYLLLPHSLI